VFFLCSICIIFSTCLWSLFLDIQNSSCFWLFYTCVTFWAAICNLKWWLCTLLAHIILKFILIAISLCLVMNTWSSTFNSSNNHIFALFVTIIQSWLFFQMSTLILVGRRYLFSMWQLFSKKFPPWHSLWLFILYKLFHENFLLVSRNIYWWVSSTVVIYFLILKSIVHNEGFLV